MVSAPRSRAPSTSSIQRCSTAAKHSASARVCGWSRARALASMAAAVSRSDRVIVATPDREIADACGEHGFLCAAPENDVAARFAEVTAPASVDDDLLARLVVDGFLAPRDGALPEETRLDIGSGVAVVVSSTRSATAL